MRTTECTFEDKFRQLDVSITLVEKFPRILFTSLLIFFKGDIWVQFNRIESLIPSKLKNESLKEKTEWMNIEFSNRNECES
jgi:hypothetical protein